MKSTFPIYLLGGAFLLFVGALAGLPFLPFPGVGRPPDGLAQFETFVMAGLNGDGDEVHVRRLTPVEVPEFVLRLKRDCPSSSWEEIQASDSPFGKQGDLEGLLPRDMLPAGETSVLLLGQDPKETWVTHRRYVDQTRGIFYYIRSKG